MKIVCFSDTHGKHKDIVIPDGDVLVFAGDFTASQEWEVYMFLKWFNEQPHKYKILVPGNHDWVCQTYESLVKEHLENYNNIHYLNNSGVTIDGINFWGTPVQPIFNSWAFNFSEKKRRQYYNEIPVSIDVLITHCPPYGILDSTKGKLLGCPILLDRVNQLSIKLHIFGHIHREAGETQVLNFPDSKRTFINCSVLDNKYKIANNPVIINI